eukprot:TRINITY_DN17692_c0_g1_i4.p1 TRINITY_DN17692_c0_g1~~TRINITY_DN17692_c0_g1_i4.p1  ORF type:complete len:650 (+),score=203.53 TRINITY_DN17692_c0_g1_i4:145-2094(+)
MCIRDRYQRRVRGIGNRTMWSRVVAIGQEALETVLGTPEPGPAPPEVDMEEDEEGAEVSPWSILRSVLASHTCDSVMTPSFVPVIETSEAPNDAFARLLDSEFMALPVQDEHTGEFIGFLKVSDLVEYILALVKASKVQDGLGAATVQMINSISSPTAREGGDLSPLDGDLARVGAALNRSHWEHARKRISKALKLTKTTSEVLLALQESVLASEDAIRTFALKHPWAEVSHNSSLLLMAEKLANSDEAHVAVLDDKHEVVNMLSLPRIAAFIATENSFWQLQLGRPILAGPISNWGCTSSTVHCLISESPAAQAFEIMCSKKSSSVAVVSTTGTLQTMITGHDLKEVVTGDRPISEVSELGVLEYLGDTAMFRTVPIAFVHDDVAEVLQKMALMHTDRVFVVDQDHALIGIVSIESMLKSVVLLSERDQAPPEETIVYLSRTMSTADASSKKLAAALCRVSLESESKIITQAHVRYIWMHLPARVRQHNWRQLYSLREHGASLQTLYKRCSVTEEPCVMVIKCADGHVFGCYTSEVWKQGGHGNGHCFVFTFEPGWSERLRVFPWTENNHVMMQGEPRSLSLGGGGGPAIEMDDQLRFGHSYRSSTFDNVCLSHCTDGTNSFEIHELEIWGLGWKKLKEVVYKDSLCK